MDIRESAIRESKQTRNRRKFKSFHENPYGDVHKPRITKTLENVSAPKRLKQMDYTHSSISERIAIPTKPVNLKSRLRPHIHISRTTVGRKKRKANRIHMSQDLTQEDSFSSYGDIQLVSTRKETTSGTNHQRRSLKYLHSKTQNITVSDDEPFAQIEYSPDPQFERVKNAGKELKSVVGMLKSKMWEE